MRKTLLVLAAAATTALAVPASAQSYRGHDGSNGTVRHSAWAAPAVGAVAGTVVGVGLHNNWFASSGAFWGTQWPTSVAGAATTGFVAGVGTAALIHAATTPCQGFHAALGNLVTSPEGCVDGQWVGRGYDTRPVRSRY